MADSAGSSQWFSLGFSVPFGAQFLVCVGYVLALALTPPTSTVRGGHAVPPPAARVDSEPFPGTSGQACLPRDQLCCGVTESQLTNFRQNQLSFKLSKTGFP